MDCYRARVDTITTADSVCFYVSGYVEYAALDMALIYRVHH